MVRHNYFPCWALRLMTNIFASFSIVACGRGEYVRLLLEDAGIPYQYIRIPIPEWESGYKAKMIEEGIRSPTLPYITVNGQYYGKTFPLNRFIARTLGQYEGKTEADRHLVDSCADIINDWIVKWAHCTFHAYNEEEFQQYKEKYVIKQYKVWNDILSDRPQGRYILGEEISYADLALYHILEEDNEEMVFKSDKYPHIVALIEAIQNRPNIKKYLATGRK